MKRILLLYNTEAGRGTVARRVASIEEVFVSKGYGVRSQPICFGQNPLEGMSEDWIVVCGGDGTINYVVNSMCEAGLDVPIGIIPTGTANDFATALGLSGRVQHVAAQLADGRVERVDCGCVNGRYFINVLSLGIFTTTSQHTPDVAKHRFGKLAYLAVGARDLRNFRQIPVTVTYDGKVLQTECLMMLIFNGETAGRFKFARTASVRDGLLDVVIVQRNNLLKAVCGVFTYFITGHDNYAVQHLCASTIDVHSTLTPETDVDGQAGPALPLHVECLKGRVQVVVPNNKEK